MKSSTAEWSIGELAGRFGLATHVLRHWESAGLLRPARRVGGQRRYTVEHLEQVALVLRGKDAGFSLEQMRRIFDAPDGAARRGMLAEHLAALDARIARLEEARRVVEHATTCESEDFLTCPVLRGLLADLVAAAPHGHDGRPAPCGAPPEPPLSRA